MASLSRPPRIEGAQPKVVRHWEDLESIQPNLLIGTTEDFEQLVEQSRNGAVDTSSIDHAIVILTYCGSRPITDTQRVVFWQTFGVPQFELYLGLDDNLLAFECEAHEGWHTAPGIRFDSYHGELLLEGNGHFGVRTGLRADVSAEACPCAGHATARLLNVEAAGAPAAAMPLAYLGLAASA